jgi:hypothetical protein
MREWKVKVDESTCGTLLGFWVFSLATPTMIVHEYVAVDPRRVLPGEFVSYKRDDPMCKIVDVQAHLTAVSGSLSLPKMSAN